MWLAVAPAQPAPVMCSGTDRKGRDCPFRGIGPLDLRPVDLLLRRPTTARPTPIRPTPSRPTAS